MKKNYDNKELELILRYTFDNKYGALTPVVIDFFKRQAYEYGYSIEEMRKRASLFKKNCKSIDFVTEESGEIESGEIGGYDIAEKRIVINKNYYEKLYKDLMDATNPKNAKNISITNGKTITKKEAEERFIEALYGTISHECSHVTSLFKNIRGVGSGLIYYPLKGKKLRIGTALGEAWNEVGSSRLLYTGREKEILEPQKTNTYLQVSFLPSLLATTCGLTDKEVFKSGMEGRASLYKTLSKNYTSINDIDVSIKLTEIEKNLSYLLYHSNNIKEKGLSVETCQNKNKVYLFEIFHRSTMFLKADMDELAKKSSEERSKKTFEEYEYRIKRAEYISLTTLSKYRGANLIDEESYQKEAKNIWDRTKGLTIYLQMLKLPYDPDNTYVKHIMEEDLDNGKTWEFPGEIREALLNQFEKPNFWQRLVKSTMRLKPEQNIQRLLNQESSINNKTNNSKKSRNDDGDREDW